MNLNVMAAKPPILREHQRKRDLSMTKSTKPDTSWVDSTFGRVPEQRMLLTEFASRLGVTAETVHEWRRAGKIRAIQIKTKYWIEKSEVERIVETL